MGIGQTVQFFVQCVVQPLRNVYVVRTSDQLVGFTMDINNRSAMFLSYFLDMASGLPPSAFSYTRMRWTVNIRE
jgi:hypothetical protein